MRSRWRSKRGCCRTRPTRQPCIWRSCPGFKPGQKSECGPDCPRRGFGGRAPCDAGRGPGAGKGFRGSDARGRSPSCTLPERARTVPTRASTLLAARKRRCSWPTWIWSSGPAAQRTRARRSKPRPAGRSRSGAPCCKRRRPRPWPPSRPDWRTHTRRVGWGSRRGRRQSCMRGPWSGLRQPRGCRAPCGMSPGERPLPAGRLRDSAGRLHPQRASPSPDRAQMWRDCSAGFSRTLPLCTARFPR